MKIKGDKAFRRAAQAAPKSAEGARKAPCSSVCICVHLWLICFFFLCVLCVSVVKCPFSRPSAVSASLRCLPQNGSFLPDLPGLPVNLPAPSDSGLPLVAGMTAFTRPTTDQRPTTSDERASSRCSRRRLARGAEYRPPRALRRERDKARGRPRRPSPRRQSGHRKAPSLPNWRFGRPFQS